MIEFATEPLPPESGAKLSKWLKMKECAILRRVASGLLRMKQEEHLEAVMKAERSDSPLAQHGNAALNDALRYHNFLTVLDEIQDPPTPLTIAKIKQFSNENGHIPGSGQDAATAES